MRASARGAPCRDGRPATSVSYALMTGGTGTRGVLRPSLGVPSRPSPAPSPGAPLSPSPGLPAAPARCRRSVVAAPPGDSWPLRMAARTALAAPSGVLAAAPAAVAAPRPPGAACALARAVRRPPGHRRRQCGRAIGRRGGGGRAPACLARGTPGSASPRAAAGSWPAARAARVSAARPCRRSGGPPAGAASCAGGRAWRAGRACHSLSTGSPLTRKRCRSSTYSCGKAHAASAERGWVCGVWLGRVRSAPLTARRGWGTPRQKPQGAARLVEAEEQPAAVRQDQVHERPRDPARRDRHRAGWAPRGARGRSRARAPGHGWCRKMSAARHPQLWKRAATVQASQRPGLWQRAAARCPGLGRGARGARGRTSRARSPAAGAPW